MSDPYVGEIRIFAGNFAPVGWSFCNGALLPISEYDVLFNLIGTTYGGDGQETFGIPNLQGRVPMHFNGTYPLGSMAGVEEVTLTSAQIAQHNHTLVATTGLAIAPTPAGNVPGQSGTVQLWTEDNANVPLDPSALLPSPGGGQPHDNMVPFQVMNYIISLYGIYPPPN